MRRLAMSKLWGRSSGYDAARDKPSTGGMKAAAEGLKTGSTRALMKAKFRSLRNGNQGVDTHAG